MNTRWRQETSAMLQLGKLGLHWPLASALGRDLHRRHNAWGWDGSTLLSFSVLGITKTRETLEAEVTLRFSAVPGPLRRFPNICVGTISLQLSCFTKSHLSTVTPKPEGRFWSCLPWGQASQCPSAAETWWRCASLWLISPSIPDSHQPPHSFLDGTHQPPEWLSCLRLSVSRDLPLLTHKMYSFSNLWWTRKTSVNCF